MAVSIDSTVQWHTDQLATEVDRKLIALSMSQGKYVGFNDIATAVWRKLEQPVTVRQLVDQLSHDFRGSAEIISGDVTALLSQLEDFGLVQVSPEP